MQNYIDQLENKGLNIYYPARDTNQDDTIGYRICTDNKNAIQDSKEVHIWFDPNSQGTLFDLGMAFSFNKPLYIVNINEIIPTNSKSFTNVILKWSSHNI